MFALKLSLDLIEEWLAKNLTDLVLGLRGDNALGLSGIATYKPMDGLMAFKVVMKQLSSLVCQVLYCFCDLYLRLNSYRW